ncbi:hypothetical protein D3C86_2170800 [compost metagenome]
MLGTAIAAGDFQGAIAEGLPDLLQHDRDLLQVGQDLGALLTATTTAATELCKVEVLR